MKHYEWASSIICVTPSSWSKAITRGEFRYVRNAGPERYIPRLQVEGEGGYFHRHMNVGLVAMRVRLFWSLKKVKIGSRLRLLGALSLVWQLVPCSGFAP